MTSTRYNAQTVLPNFLTLAFPHALHCDHWGSKKASHFSSLLPEAFLQTFFCSLPFLEST